MHFWTMQHTQSRGYIKCLERSFDSCLTKEREHSRKECLKHTQHIYSSQVKVELRCRTNIDVCKDETNIDCQSTAYLQLSLEERLQDSFEANSDSHSIAPGKSRGENRQWVQFTVQGWLVESSHRVHWPDSSLKKRERVTSEQRQICFTVWV